MILDLGVRGKNLGIENNAYGLTHYNGRVVEEALSGACDLIEASDLVSRIRLVKSAGRARLCQKGRKARRPRIGGGDQGHQGRRR